MLGEHPDVPNTLKHCFDGRAGVVAADLLLNAIEFAASDVRPI
jgi:hypothetical protein